jgi:hypothetical protein
MSKDVFIPFASSIVMMPLLPTRSIASAMMRPIDLSPFADIVPMSSICSRVVIGVDVLRNDSMIFFEAISIPCLSDVAE